VCCRRFLCGTGETALLARDSQLPPLVDIAAIPTRVIEPVALAGASMAKSMAKLRRNACQGRPLKSGMSFIA
jgi:hypothetical protein